MWSNGSCTSPPAREGPAKVGFQTPLARGIRRRPAELIDHRALKRLQASLVVRLNRPTFPSPPRMTIRVSSPRDCGLTLQHFGREGGRISRVAAARDGRGIPALLTPFSVVALLCGGLSNGRPGIRASQSGSVRAARQSPAKSRPPSRRWFSSLLVDAGLGLRDAGFRFHTQSRSHQIPSARCGPPLPREPGPVQGFRLFECLVTGMGEKRVARANGEKKKHTKLELSNGSRDRDPLSLFFSQACLVSAEHMQSFRARSPAVSRLHADAPQPSQRLFILPSEQVIGLLDGGQPKCGS